MIANPTPLHIIQDAPSLPPVRAVTLSSGLHHHYPLLDFLLTDIYGYGVPIEILSRYPYVQRTKDYLAFFCWLATTIGFLLKLML
jgi:hypothetical protein